MDPTETIFRETSRQAYPYRMLHTADCASAKRAKYFEEQTFEKVAESKSNLYYHTDWHEGCIKPDNDLYMALLRRSGVLHRERLAKEKRERNLVELSILETAVDLLKEELGPLTDEEQGFDTARKEQLRNGKFRPRSGRFDATEYVVSKAPPIESAY